MANVKTVFLGTERSKTNQDELQLFANVYDEIYISIDGVEDGSYICLDVDTAIQFCKQLKKEIGLIKQNQKDG